MTELQKRIASAAVLAPVALAALIVGGFAFVILVVAVAAIGLWEWTTIGGAKAPAPCAAAIAVLAAGLMALQALEPQYGLALLLGAILVSLAAGLGNRDARWIGFGLTYLAIPCASFALLRQAEPSGAAAILFILAVVWATDIAAYFGGRAMGGPKLWPRVSPKKTWSGALSGFIAALVAGGLVAVATGAGSFVAGFVLAAPLSVAAQAGDLFESSVKRHFGVKDSGTIIPGHGGVLDRVDGLLAAAAIAWPIAALGLGGGILTLPGGAP